MPYVETFYDYEIHKKCFRVSESAGYTHTTDTVFKNSSIDASLINYFTAVFSLDVIRNVGDSKVGIYDNNVLLELVDFNEQTAKITNLSFNLAYDMEHNLEARYIGNDECLPSKSMVIPLYQPLPGGFGTLMNFRYNNSDITTDDFNIPVPVTSSLVMDVVLTNELESALYDKEVKLIVDNGSPVTENTDSNGVASFTLSNLSYGLHKLKAVFEGDSHYVGFERELNFYFGFTATVTARKCLVGQKPIFDVHIEDFTGMPQQYTVSLWSSD